MAVHRPNLALPVQRRGQLVIPALGLAAALLLGASGGPGARPRSATRAPQSTRTVVVIQDLEQGRHFAAVVDGQKPAFDRLDGTLRSGDTEARVTAFLERGALRLIEETAVYGERGGSGRNRYYVHEGRLAYYESLRIRPRELGRDRAPARDEVITALAYDESGRLVGSEKTVNREPAALDPIDEQSAQRRFAALARVAAQSASAAR